MATLKFTKMQGLGNDFLVVNCLGDDCPDLGSLAQKLGDRRFGVGFDQMLILRPSERADFKMEIINQDGSQVEMCGNGIRCVAKFLISQGATTKQEFSIETLGGIIRPKLVGDLVEVDMGEPELEGPKIPVNLNSRVINHPLELQKKDFSITCVSMGNPHCVLFVEDVDAFPVAELGPVFENHPLFPNRINTEFIQVIDDAHLKMRVWERGAGETLACGTGACAALVASVLTGHSQREATLYLRGGELNIRWSETDNHVYMTGPGEEVYSGELNLS